jgi:trk system potassium uptake protein TrkA
MSETNYIVVVGCGRLGSMLANRLSAAGHELVVIDKSEPQFDKLSTEYSGFRVVGDASELSVLRKAHTERADYLFATTTEDNVNLMVAQVAHNVFEVPHVIARVFDPAREAIYGELGVETISPTLLAADAFLAIVQAKG